MNGRTRQSGKRCICPRALILIAKDNKARRDRAREKAAKRPVERGPRVLTNVAVGTWVENDVHAPDLSGGACLTPEGMIAFDKVLSGNGNAHTRGIIDAKALCRRCPRTIWERCDSYVRKGEGDHPGIWRGVYAGKTAAERRARGRNGVA